MSNNPVTLRREDAEYILRFFESNRKELNSMVIWKQEAPIIEFWEMHGYCEDHIRDALAQSSMDVATQEKAGP